MLCFDVSVPQYREAGSSLRVRNAQEQIWHARHQIYLDTRGVSAQGSSKPRSRVTFAQGSSVAFATHLQRRPCAMLVPASALCIMRLPAICGNVHACYPLACGGAQSALIHLVQHLTPGDACTVGI